MGKKISFGKYSDFVAKNCISFYIILVHCSRSQCTSSNADDAIKTDVLQLFVFQFHVKKFINNTTNNIGGIYSKNMWNQHVSNRFKEIRKYDWTSYLTNNCTGANVNHCHFIHFIDKIFKFLYVSFFSLYFSYKIIKKNNK